MKRYSGISLSELLIGLFLSSMLMALLLQLYLNTKRLYGESEKILAAHFEVQGVAELLKNSIRRAGFTPCLNLDELHLMRSGERLQGVKISEDSLSSIHINRMSEHFVPIISFLDSQHLLVSSDAFLDKTHPMLIVDCNHAELRRMVNIAPHSQGKLITLDHPLHFSYSMTAYLGAFYEERWFIKKNKQGAPGLYYQMQHVEEMSSLIHSLTIHQKSREPLFEVVMGLTSGDVYQFMVSVRGR